MGLFSNPFGSKPQQPAAPTNDDHVYPLHTLDVVEGAKKHIVAWTYVFNDVIDPEKLHSSFLRLLTIGNWRKLGGRVVLKDGKFEINVPRSFTDERPGVVFTREDVTHMSIDHHPIASKLAQQTDTPRSERWNDGFYSLAGRQDVPTQLEQYTNTDVPIMSLHVTSFSDATIVALSWPHVLMDSVGQADMMRAWSSVLAGKDDEVPPVIATETDCLWDTVGPHTGEKEPSVLEEHRMSGKGMAKMISRYVWNETTKGAAEPGIIYLPKDTADKIHAMCVEGLSAETDKNRLDTSESIIAWLTQQVIASEKPMPVIVMGGLNARNHIPSLKDGGVYLQNMVMGSFTFLSQDLAQGSLGDLAKAHLECIASQTTEPQAKSLLWNMLREHSAGRDFKPFFGDPNAMLILFNNLSNMDMVNAVDFGPAVAKPGKGGSTPPGKAVYCHLSETSKGIAARNYFTIYGKDYQGNYWINGALTPSQWDLVDAAFKKL